MSRYGWVGDAGAIEAHIAGGHELLEHLDHRRQLVGRFEGAVAQGTRRSGRPEPAQAAVAGGAYVSGGDVGSATGLRRLAGHVAEFRHDRDLVAAAGERPSEHLLAVPAAAVRL